MKRTLLVVLFIALLISITGQVTSASTVALYLEETPAGITCVEGMEIEIFYPNNVSLQGKVQWLKTGWLALSNELNTPKQIQGIKDKPYLPWKLDVPEAHSALIIVAIGPGNPIEDGSAIFKMDLAGLEDMDDLILGRFCVLDSLGSKSEGSEVRMSLVEESPIKGAAVAPHGKLATTWGAMKQ